MSGYVIAKLSQQDADVALVDAKVRRKILAARHGGTVARRGRAHSRFWSTGRLRSLAARRAGTEPRQRLA